MTTPTGRDPIDRLHDADPTRVDDVPDASLARVSARIQEHIMTSNQDESKATSNRRSFALIGGAAVVGALALAIAFGSGFGAPAAGPIAANPTPTTAPSDELPDGGGGVQLGSCLAYDPSILRTMDVVFDGTVTAIEGDQVTFDVNTGWRGVDASVTLTAAQTEVSLLGPTPDFEVGGRYLVTAAGSSINSCGYTLDYDADTAATWAAAFGS
jgi:hypothetical protein